MLFSLRLRPASSLGIQTGVATTGDTRDLPAASWLLCLCSHGSRRPGQTGSEPQPFPPAGGQAGSPLLPSHERCMSSTKKVAHMDTGQTASLALLVLLAWKELGAWRCEHALGTPRPLWRTQCPDPSVSPTRAPTRPPRGPPEGSAGPAQARKPTQTREGHWAAPLECSRRLPSPTRVSSAGSAGWDGVR